MQYDDDYRETPHSVVFAVSSGTVPLPFLAVYAILFILHGWVHPVHPPDITSSQHGELIAGLVAAAAFVVLTVALLWFLNARRRWPFAVAQLAVLGVSIWFLLDQTKGGPVVSVLLALAALVSLAFGFAPDSWHHLGSTPPAPIERAYGLLPTAGATPDTGDQHALPGSTPPTLVEPSSLRRRRSSGSR